jgi:hypothetical protein
MKLGFIKKEKKKDELEFDFPYLIMEPRPIETGKVHKFWLKGMDIKDILKLQEKDNKLSWLFDENSDDNVFYIVNINDVEEDVDPTINLNLGLDFNNKKLHEKMTDLMGLDPVELHKFKLEESEVLGLPAVKIVDFAVDTTAIVNPEEGITPVEEAPIEESSDNNNNII